MQNNYTTHNWNVTSPMFQTQLVQFAKPRIAFVKGLLVELYGMNLVTVMNPAKERLHEKFKSYRILLKNPELEHYTTIDEEENQYFFYFMPEERALSDKDFKTYIERTYDQNCISEGLDNLEKYGYYLSNKPESLTCEVSCYGESVYLTSHLFKFIINLGDKDYVLPTQLYDLLNMFNYLDVPFEFVAGHESDAKENMIAKELARMLAAYANDNFYTDGHTESVDYDGTYVYSKDLGKVKMSREDYFSRFPEAELMLVKP